MSIQISNKTTDNLQPAEPSICSEYLFMNDVSLVHQTKNET